MEDSVIIDESSESSSKHRIGLTGKIGKVAEKAKDLSGRAQESIISAIDQNDDGSFDIKDVKVIATTIGNATSDAAKAAASSFKSSIEESRRAKYNPIFVDNITADDFKYPDIIRVVDSDKDRLKFYPDSVGWIDDNNDIPILNLYYSSVKNNHFDVKLRPILQNAIYYYDHVNHLEYVNLSQYFVEAQISRQVELQKIACDLGAKYYNVQIIEEETSKSSRDAKVKGLGSLGIGKKSQSANVGLSQNASSTDRQKTKISTGVRFSEGVEPVRPQLTWFKNDKQIQQLIEMRLANDRQMSSYDLVFECSSLSAMSVDTAAKLDGIAIAAKAQIGFSIKDKLVKENSKKLLFYIEF